MILSVIEYCCGCKLCFYYPIMFVDDDDVLRLSASQWTAANAAASVLLAAYVKKESNRLHENRLLSL